MTDLFRTIKPKFLQSRQNLEEGRFYSRVGESDENLDDSQADAESHDGMLREKAPFRHSTQSVWARYRGLIIAHIVLFSVYAGSLVAVHRSSSRCLRDVGLPFSPAIEALEFQEQTFSLEDRIQDRGSFSGRPNPDLDKAWHDLLNYENIKLEPEVIKHYQREDISVPLPEGGGYIGTLNVYHELHCLKRLHQYMYQEYYWPDLDAAQLEMNRLHNEHCIDFLRQTAMCHGDIGLITYQWIETSRIPVANATSHQCVNWEKLDSWTRARSVDMFKPGWLVHPTKGLAYPQGEGDKVGGVSAGHHDH